MKHHVWPRAWSLAVPVFLSALWASCFWASSASAWHLAGGRTVSESFFPADTIDFAACPDDVMVLLVGSGTERFVQTAAIEPNGAITYSARVPVRSGAHHIACARNRASSQVHVYLFSRPSTAWNLVRQCSGLCWSFLFDCCTYLWGMRQVNAAIERAPLVAGEVGVFSVMAEVPSGQTAPWEGMAPSVIFAQPDVAVFRTYDGAGNAAIFSATTNGIVGTPFGRVSGIRARALASFDADDGTGQLWTLVSEAPYFSMATRWDRVAAREPLTSPLEEMTRWVLSAAATSDRIAIASRRDAPAVYVRLGRALLTARIGRVTYVKPSTDDFGFGVTNEFGLSLSDSGSVLGVESLRHSELSRKNGRWSFVRTVESQGNGLSADGQTLLLERDGTLQTFQRVQGTWRPDGPIPRQQALLNSMSVSRDGSVLAVCYASPRVFDISVYTRVGSAWTLTELRADQRVSTVALSPDGTRIAASLYDRDARTSRILLFRRSATGWSTEAVLRGSRAEFSFIRRLKFSGDGHTLAAGDTDDASGSRGIDGDPSDRGRPQSGAVYVFRLLGTAWTPDAYLKASNADAGDNFGNALALSRDGNTLIVGAPWEDGAARGLGGDESSNSAPDSGAVYVFERQSRWSQTAYLKAPNADSEDRFGSSVGVASDGVLAVGAPGETSSARGIDGDMWNNDDVLVSRRSGAVFLY